MATVKVALDLTRIDADQMARLAELAATAEASRRDAVLWWLRATWLFDSLKGAAAGTLIGHVLIIGAALIGRAQGYHANLYSEAMAVSWGVLIVLSTMWWVYRREYCQSHRRAMADSCAVSAFIEETWGISASNQDAEKSKDIHVEDLAW
jgi:hypothetical protein